MKSLKFLNAYLLRYKTRLLLGVVFVTVSNIFAIYPAEILRKGIDMVHHGIQVYYQFKGASLERDLISGFFTLLLILGLAVICTALLKGLFMFFMRQTIIVMSRLVEYDLKNDIFAQYQRLDFAFYKRNKTGDLMARIGEDVSQVRMYVGPAIMYAISTVTLFFLVLGRMVSVEPELTLYVLSPLPFLALAIYLVNSTVIKKSERVQQQLSIISSRVQESLSGIRVVKAYAQENYYANVFGGETEEYKNRNLRLVQISALFQPLIVVLIGLSTLITVYVGGLKVQTGEISAGIIGEFILYVNMLTWPVASIGWVTSIVQRAAASQQRINEFMEQKPIIVNENIEPFTLQGKVQFKGVGFRYPENGVEALHDVSFTLEKGKSLAFIGRTGSGKSTVAALVTRLYDVSQGEILIDGNSIKAINLDHYRSSLSYVPQDVFLFSDTIKANISFGFHPSKVADNENQLIIEAAAEAAILEHIEAFPEKFETRIGERGVTLSGGQKQRISIARALVRNPQLLIFDDCLSAVDTATEESILNNLKRKMEGKTCIFIAHRISTIKHCDEIIVLENGSIAERGSHQTLIAQGGIYASMYRKQLLEEKAKE
jgi:ATP-binding cassette subfamily B multidrug efflux pump